MSRQTTARLNGAVLETPLPNGFRVALDPDTKQLDEATLFGGSPARVMRLSASGRTAWAELQDGPVRSAAGGALARRLTDAGIAHPRPPASAQPVDVGVVIPVRDRADMLARCLTALGGRYPVLVVDDGSSDPRAIADVAATHGATLVRRPENGGPASARNSGISQIGNEVVAFVDSDCIPPSGWIEMLSAHLTDPLVAAVAPRILTLPSETSAGRYGAAKGSLDLGEREARVAPATRVAYVPTAALLVRRRALVQAARDGEIFDPALRYGEDVDLIWRLHEAGWRIRYDPAIEVRHHEPDSWPALLSRRFRYGTSAAPLAQRHPGNLAPLVLQPWPALTVAGLLARRPSLAAVGYAASVLTMRNVLHGAGLPAAGVARAMLTAAAQTWLGMGKYATQFAAPALAALLVVSSGATGSRRWMRRAALGSLLLGSPLTAWSARRPAMGTARFTMAHLADDIAYGAGVYAGCVRTRTTKPLRPRVAWRPVRLTRSVATAPADSKGST
jgi:mycofactocin system glycosyltransferase